MFPVRSSKEKGHGSRGCSRGSGVGVDLIVCGPGCGLDAGAQRRRLTAAMNGKRSVPHDPTSDRRGRPATYARYSNSYATKAKASGALPLKRTSGLTDCFGSWPIRACTTSPATYPSALRCGIGSTFAGSSPHRRASRSGMLRSMQRLRIIRVNGSRCETEHWSYGSVSEKRLNRIIRWLSRWPIAVAPHTKV